MKLYAVALVVAGSLVATSAWAGGARTRKVQEQRVQEITTPAPSVQTIVVERIVERPVERVVTNEVVHVVEKPVIQERVVERVVEKPVERVVERVVERPVERIVYRDRIVERTAGSRQIRRPAK